MTTEMRRIESRAPTRIDLAGGTLDIWPLYLFLKSPLTLNLGIDLFAEARIEEFEAPSETSDQSGEVVLKSEDQGVEERMTWDSLSQFNPPPSLILHWKLLREFTQKRIASGFHDPRVSFRMVTKARSPAGAGAAGWRTRRVRCRGSAARASRPARGR
jgi:D-glycero-alpha-D-manno-heptose-7-phosphate kinase